MQPRDRRRAFESGKVAAKRELGARQLRSRVAGANRVGSRRGFDRHRPQANLEALLCTRTEREHDARERYRPANSTRSAP
jgi:hypothetical protein